MKDSSDGKVQHYEVDLTANYIFKKLQIHIYKYGCLFILHILVLVMTHYKIKIKPYRIPILHISLVPILHTLFCTHFFLFL